MSAMSELHASILDSRTAALRVGQHVYCGLHGGRYGVIYAIHGTPSPASCGSLGGIVMHGGAASVDVIFDEGESRGLPECILRGVQWKIFDQYATADEIAEMRMDAAKHKDDDRIRKLAAEDQFQAEVSALKSRADLAYLERLAGNHQSGVNVARNVRKMLKKHFPKVKFAVRADYNTVRVQWDNGPTAPQVETLIGCFQGGDFDGMEDIYRPARSAWCEVFGGCRYIFTTRDVTRDAEERAFAAHFPTGLRYRDEFYPTLPAEFWDLPHDGGGIIRRAIHRTAFDLQGNPINVKAD